MEKLLEDEAARVVATSRAGLNWQNTRLDNRRIGTLSASTEWTDALRNVDVVFHCAAETPGKRSDLTSLMAANRDGALALARQAATVGVTRFVFLSTAQVHGVSTHGKPYDEMSPPNPQSPYAVSKWEAEEGVLEIAKETGLAVTIIRPPLVYGPGVKGNLAPTGEAGQPGRTAPFCFRCQSEEPRRTRQSDRFSLPQRAPPGSMQRNLPGFRWAGSFNGRNPATCCR